MKKIILGVILLVISSVLLVCLGIAEGFYNQIVATGFIPDALFFVISFFGISGIIVGLGIIGLEITK